MAQTSKTQQFEEFSRHIVAQSCLLNLECQAINYFVHIHSSRSAPGDLGKVREERSGRSWPNQKPTGVKLRLLGLKLGRTGAHLGPSSWAEVGALLAEVRANVAAMSDRNGAFGRFWADLQKVQIATVPCTFWRPALSKMSFPPSWSCTSLTDSLLN